MPPSILDKIDAKAARVVVVGLGYVGLPLAVAFARAGFLTRGIDVDPERVAAVNAGRSYVGDVLSDDLAAAVRPRRLAATTDYGILADADAVIICVPTPLSKTKSPDITAIVAAADRIAEFSHDGMLVVLESTTYPGTTEEVILPRLAANGRRVGENFFLAFSPERIDPGRKDYTLRNTPKVIGGVTTVCLRTATRLYEHVVDRVVPVSSTQAAEMVKLLENTFRAVNIALVNEVAIMCDKLGLDVWEVIGAAATKPFGFMRFDPGPGLGGHCLPVDPLYLSWKLRALNYKARFIDLASEINGSMPEFWAAKVADALNEAGKPVKGSRVLLLGVTYKPGVSDLRESPALDIIRLLQARGAVVTYHDPYVPTLRYEELQMTSMELSEPLLRSVDCVIIATHHPSYDWEWLARCTTRLVDTRGIVRAGLGGRARPSVRAV